MQRKRQRDDAENYNGPAKRTRSQGPVAEVEMKEVKELTPAVKDTFYKQMQRCLVSFHDKHKQAPHPGHVLLALCNTYWQEGQKLRRKGHHDSLAQRIYERLKKAEHPIDAINHVLKDKTLRAGCQFTEMMRAFLSYHPHCIASLENSVITNIQPQPYSFSVDTTDLDTLISMSHNLEACRVLQKSFFLVPDARKEQVVIVLQKRFAVSNEPEIGSMLINIAQSFPHFTNMIINNLMENLSKDAIRQKLSCVVLANYFKDVSDKYKKQEFIEILAQVVFSQSVYSDFVRVGIQTLEEFVEVVPDDLKEKTIIQLMKMKDKQLLNEEFLKVFFSTLSLFSCFVNNELKNKVISFILIKLLEIPIELKYIAKKALIELMSNMPVERKDELVRYFLNLLQDEKTELNARHVCIMALDEKMITTNTIDDVVRALLETLNKSKNSTFIGLAGIGLAGLVNIIPEKFVKDVINAIYVSDFELEGMVHPRLCMSVLAINAKFTTPIIDYLMNLFEKEDEAVRAKVVSFALRIVDQLSEKFNEDICNWINAKLLATGEIDHLYNLCAIILGSPYKKIQQLALNALLNQLNIGDVSHQRGVIVCLGDLLCENDLSDRNGDAIALGIYEKLKSHEEQVRIMALIQLGWLAAKKKIPEIVFHNLLKELLAILSKFHLDDNSDSLSLCRVFNELVIIASDSQKGQIFEFGVARLKHHRNYNGQDHKETCDLLKKTMIAVSDSKITELVDVLVNTKLFQPCITPCVELLETLIDLHPNRFDQMVLNKIIQNSDNWSIDFEPLFKAILRNANRDAKNYLVFGMIDDAIPLLNVTLAGNDTIAQEKMMIGLIKIKADYCADFQTEIELTARLGANRDLTRMVMMYRG